MPVWHEMTEEARANGELVLIGITQEQHPDRCRLFAQWKGFDWPILWDPFNLTGTEVVPVHMAVDEHGVLQSQGGRFDFEAFLAQSSPPPRGTGEPQPADASADASTGLVQLRRFPEESFEYEHFKALSQLLWKAPEGIDAAVEALEEQAAARPEDGALSFRAGVARRMRYDSQHTRPGDFQAALDHWARALALQPNQYIWRRRIQQYGPRLDKPYPFYSWIDEARGELRARGETPVELRAALTPAELAEPQRSLVEGGGALEPDAQGRIARDERGLISIESAQAFDTSKARPVASVHLTLRPNAELQAHWNHEAGALQVWVDAPEGWKLDGALLEDPPRSDTDVSDEPRQLTLEVELPAAGAEGRLVGYALYYVCEGVEGTCLYLRQDFELELAAPGPK